MGYGAGAPPGTGPILMGGSTVGVETIRHESAMWRERHQPLGVIPFRSWVIDPPEDRERAKLLLNQAAKQEAYDLYKRGVRGASWARIRDGEDYRRPAPVEITDDWWPEEGG